MSSFGEVTGAPIVLTLEGRQVQLAKPKRKVLGELYAQWVEQDLQALTKLLDAAQADPSERRNQLLEFRNRSRLASYPLACLFDFGRAEQTLLKAGVDEAVLDALDDEQTRQLAMRMWGFRWTEPAGDEPGQENGNPKG